MDWRIGTIEAEQQLPGRNGPRSQPPLTPVAPPLQPPVDTLAPCFLVRVVGGYILELWGMDDPCRLQGFNKNDKYHQGSRVTITQPDGYW